MYLSKVFLVAALFLSSCVFSTESEKILAIFSIPSPSHYIFALPMLKELAARGHEVTSINTYPQSKPIKNFKDLFIEKNLYILEDFFKTVTDGSELSTWDVTLWWADISEKLCKNILENQQVQEILHSSEIKFDLIILEHSFTESLLGLGSHFKAPIIGVSTFGTMLSIDESLGNPSPASITPNVNLPYRSQMSFLERLINFKDLTTFYIIHKLNSYYRQRALYNKYFPHAELSFDEAVTNVSLVLLNQHHSLSYPRPYVPNMIEVGGLHIKQKPDPLPAQIQTFLDNAPEGVLYFSMGSNLRSKDLSPEYMDIFLNTFRSLKQKVLWKFEDTEMPNKPDNVYISQWVPQAGVLAHPNVKVFMTHGGLLSTTEAIFYGKPILGIPMLADQPRNVYFAVQRGFALSVDFNTLTEKELKEKVNEMLYNPKYFARVQEISSHYHDQPMKPMETAMYWIEYVIRHHGAAHLRNAGVDMNILQYYSIDVIGIYLASLLIIILTIKWTLKTSLKYLSGYMKINQKLKRG